MTALETSRTTAHFPIRRFPVPRFDYPRHTLDLHGTRLAYWDEGGTGAPLLLLHGIGASIEAWAWVMPQWAEKYRIVAIDLPGHGESSIPHDGSHSLESAAAMVNAVIRHLHLERPLVVGHSLGTGIALQWAITHPGRYRGLALIAPMGFGSEIDAFTRLLSVPRLGEFLFQPSKAFVRLSLSYNEPVRGLEQFVEMKHKHLNRPGVRDWHLRLIREGVGLAGQKIRFSKLALAGLTAPTLIIAGDKDRLFPIHHAQRAAKLIHRARLHVLLGGGHDLPTERAAQVAELVGQFAAEVMVG